MTERGANKYRAVKTEVDGITFHSKKEAARYGELKLLQKMGTITGLCLQVPYVFELNDVKICRYFADFTYHDGRQLIVEDVKGQRTKDYMIKRKLMKAFFGIDILET